MTQVLYLCPLGAQQRAWRLAAAPPDLTVDMRRTNELTQDALYEAASRADALISERAGLIDDALLAAAPRLRLIMRYGSLTHDIDLAAAAARGVAVHARPIRGTIAVAENVMLQMLALLRRAQPLQHVMRTPPETFQIGEPPHAPRRTSEDVFAFNWSGQTRVALLQNKTVGVLGFGEIGAELARRLTGWGCTLLYSKRQRLPESAERALGVTFRGADAIVRESDVLVSLLPYFQETDLWLNAARIATMKAGAYLVHAGSGSVIDEAAVARALGSGALGGASFDTFEYEPLPQNSPLLTLADTGANILLLPHIGSCNDGAGNEMQTIFADVRDGLRGAPLPGRLA